MTKQKIVYSPHERICINKYGDEEKVRVFGAGLPEAFWGNLDDMIAALGLGVSSSLAAANNKSYTETRNTNSSLSTPLTYVGIAAAVAAVSIAAIIVFGKK